MKRIISKRPLREFWEKHRDSEEHLKVWYQTASNADWHTPQDVKKMYVNASIVANNRVVFNIKGNAYRLIVKFNYERQWAFIRFVGTHSEYDAIDATTI
jgi:mRNA interferase HigB